MAITGPSVLEIELTDATNFSVFFVLEPKTYNTYPSINKGEEFIN